MLNLGMLVSMTKEKVIDTVIETTVVAGVATGTVLAVYTGADLIKGAFTKESPNSNGDHKHVTTKKKVSKRPSKKIVVAAK